MPQSTVFRSADPYEHQRLIRAGEVEVLVTKPGEFLGEITRIDLHSLWMQRCRESLPRIVHSAVSKDRNAMVFLADAQQAPMRHTGMELAPGCIMFYSSGSVHHHRSSGASHWAAMSLTPEDLAAAGQAIAGRNLTAPKANQLIRPQPVPMDRLLRLHAAAGHLAATTPDILAKPAVAEAIEQALVSAMVSCLTDDNSEQTYVRHQRVPIMRRFERVIEANPGKPLYPAEICAAIGVPARTLRHHCWHHLGMGPQQYLLLRRMNMARRALALADPRTQTVTEIATDHGFWELGRFSVAFRELFGESPSVTLHRPTDDGRCTAFDSSPWVFAETA